MENAAEHAQCPFPAHEPPVRIPLVTLSAHPCPYLPGRQSESRAFAAHEFPAELYHRFMDANFRRSGELFYQPTCRGCRACMQIRVPVGTFRPSKSQRRCWRANQDLVTTVEPSQATDEKFDLYCRYQKSRHHSPEEKERASFEAFLGTSPVETLDICHRTGDGELVAVGVCDICRQSLSSVYFYFDPDESQRGLGTFGALWEIEMTRRMRIPYYYLGYWVKGCRSMEYKANFRPCQVLTPEGEWVELLAMP